MKDNKKVDINKARAEYGKEQYRDSYSPNATNGINTPGIELPAFNPPVPNRAWTEMKKELGAENSVKPDSVSTDYELADKKSK